MMDWTAAQVERITDTVSRAPSVHNMRPWTLRFRPGRIELCERSEVVLPRHDPDGRDRLISCGAAVANLELAVRHAGLRTSLALLPAEDRPRLVACLHVLGRGESKPAVECRYSAIFRRHSYRAPFGTGRVKPALREALSSERGIAQDGDVWGVQLRTLDSHGELSSLAGLLAHAGSVLRVDNAYQRELAAWSSEVAGGMPPPIANTLPWAGLVRTTTHLPDVPTLTERLRRELVLVVLTVDDGRLDHVRAGIVLQRTWLTAITAGLVASVHTQALQLHEIRAGLIERLRLAGYPQLIMRFGSPGELTATDPTASTTAAS